MKKIFISCPMKDRTKENTIKQLKAMAKAYYLDEEVEFVDTIVLQSPPDNVNKDVWYLGKSIEILSQCDTLVTVGDYYEFNGCRAEYNIEVLYMPVFASESVDPLCQAH